MQDDQHSPSALFCAFVRAYHTGQDNPRLFDDFLAGSLLPEATRASLEHELVWHFQTRHPALAYLYPDRAGALARIMRFIPTPPIVLSRARYVEDSLEQAVQDGVKQYVLVGAGMDTFAFRRPEVLEQVRVFEVDHPATQSFKLRRIAELGRRQPQGLYFVPVDFNRESLAAALARSSPYDRRVLSFFNWLGVTYYLPRAAVLATFQAIAETAPAGSTVVFDYFDTGAQDPQAAGRVRWMLEGSQRSEEPLLTCLDPARLAAELAGAGLRLQEDLGPQDIQQRYFQDRTDGYRALEHAHIAAAVVA